MPPRSGRFHPDQIAAAIVNDAPPVRARDKPSPTHAARSSRNKPGAAGRRAAFQAASAQIPRVQLSKNLYQRKHRRQSGDNNSSAETLVRFHLAESHSAPD